MSNPNLPEGATVEMVDVPAFDFNRTHEMGDVVRLGEDIGSAAQRKQIWRVTSVPNPKATRKAQREAYGVTPVGGGRGLYAEGWMLEPASDRDKAIAAQTPAVDRFLPGTVVTASRLRGVTTADKMVVLAENTDGTVKLAVLNGDGRIWSKIPLANLRRASL